MMNSRVYLEKLKGRPKNTLEDFLAMKTNQVTLILLMLKLLS